MDELQGIHAPACAPFSACRAQEEGLSLPWDSTYFAVLAGTSGQSVEQYVAGLKAAKQAQEAR